MFNHQGGLANLTAAINAAQSNIQSLSSEEKDGRAGVESHGLASR